MISTHPQPDAPLAGASSANAGAQRQAAQTILIVEDEDAVRTVARLFLQSFGYTALEAATAAAAVDVCRRHPDPIDLVLCDVDLGSVAGTTLSHELLQIRPEMKLIYMSGCSSAAVGKHGAPTVAMPFIQKPFSPEQLADKIRRTLE